VQAAAGRERVGRVGVSAALGVSEVVPGVAKGRLEACAKKREGAALDVLAVAHDFHGVIATCRDGVRGSVRPILVVLY